MDYSERIQSIAHCAADITRWCILGAISGKMSEDRRRDIAAQAARIIYLVEKPQ